MVYGLAAQSGGVIRIQSRLGAGTTVELWLPVAAAEEAQRPRPAATLAVVPTRSFAVLLVDDDPMVSSGTSAMLQDLGHSVVTAASAAHALDMLRCETPVDLVITDHAMPGMTGAELAKHIRDMRPDLPIILATGYAEVPNNLISGMPRLDKPYRLDKLASMIAAVVEHRMLDVTPAA
jgi:CheY-like chemotaxis protein